MIRTLAEHWWVLLLRGIVAILFGLIAYARPVLTIAVLVLLWGAYALVDGIFEVVAGVKAKYGTLIFLGILGIAAGLVTFFWTAITAITLLYVIAFWAIVAGVMQIAAAIRLRKEVQGEWLWILSGVCTRRPRRPAHRAAGRRRPVAGLADRIVRDRVGDPAGDPRLPPEGAPRKAGGEAGVSRVVIPSAARDPFSAPVRLEKGSLGAARLGMTWLPTRIARRRAESLRSCSAP